MNARRILGAGMVGALLAAASGTVSCGETNEGVAPFGSAGAPNSTGGTSSVMGPGSASGGTVTASAGRTSAGGAMPGGASSGAPGALGNGGRVDDTGAAGGGSDGIGASGTGGSGGAPSAGGAGLATTGGEGSVSPGGQPTMGNSGGTASGSGGTSLRGGADGRGVGAAGGSVGAAGAGGGLPYATLPCDVQAVLKSRCASCHGVLPTNGAPISLVVWEDVNAYALAIQEKLEQDSMPPPGAPSLSPAQMSTLITYTSLGAPPSLPMICP